MGNRVHIRGLAVSLGVGLASMACGHEGNPGGQTGEEGGEPLCRETMHSIDLDTVQPLGFSARRLLDLALGSHAAPLHWQSGAYGYGPEHGVGTVTVAVSDIGGAARFVDSEPVQGGQELASLCPDRIEVGAALTLSTAGGAFDESLPVTLSATDARVTTLSLALDSEALAGQFAFDDGALDGSTVLELLLESVFTDYGNTGSLSASFEHRTSDAVSMFGQSLATWPTETLCSSGVTVPFDGGMASAQAGIELFDDVAGLLLVMPDARRVPVEARALHAGAPACMVFGFDAGARPAGSVLTDITLTVATEDGAVDHDFQGQLAVVPAGDGSLSEVTVSATCRSETAAGLIAQCGDWGVDLTGYDAASVVVDLTVRPTSGAPRLEGAFTIRGERQPPCDDVPSDENGSGGCQGVQLTELGVVPFEPQ